MAASPATLLAAAMHLQRMRKLREEEIRLGVPLERRLTATQLVDATADPADRLITSLLLNREFKAECPDDPAAITDRVIAAARRPPRPT